jgi:hypothetical protein
MLIDLTDEEKELIVSGLEMRRNFIETGSPTLSARDCKNMGKEKQINPLVHERYESIIQIDHLIDKVIKS